MLLVLFIADKICNPQSSYVRFVVIYEMILLARYYGTYIENIAGCPVVMV